MFKAETFKMETVAATGRSTRPAAVLVRRALQVRNGITWARRTWVREVWNRSAARPSRLLRATGMDSGHSRRHRTARYRGVNRTRPQRAAAVAGTGTGLRRVRLSNVRWAGLR